MGTSGSATYTYDLFNRQKTHTSGGVVTTTTYRPDGLRHSIGGTKHIWDGQNIVGEYVGTAYKKYFRALTLIYRLASNTKQWYNTNGHGDVIALTNATGTVVKTYTYNAFGEEQDISNTDGNPFRYCGEYYDTACGTLYLRARNYDATTGRFTQEDPIRADGNFYAYCGSNPVNAWDPSGNKTFSLSLNFSFFFIAGFSFSISFVFDDRGNIGIQTASANINKNGGGFVFGAASVGGSISITKTSRDTIYDLEDIGYNAGGSVNVYGPVTAGADVILAPKEDNSKEIEPIGNSISIGVGVGPDIHFAATKTKTLCSTNIYGKNSKSSSDSEKTDKQSNTKSSNTSNVYAAKTSNSDLRKRRIGNYIGDEYMEDIINIKARRHNKELILRERKMSEINYEMSQTYI